MDAGKLKVLGILGSPRKKGNTELLLNEALKGAEGGGAAVERIETRKLKIAPCDESYRCMEAGECAVRDAMQEVYPKLLDADGIILAAPIFFYGLPSQTKALIDRCQSLWVRKYILKKPFAPSKRRKGVFVSVGATSGAKLFDGAVLTVKYFFDVLDAEYAGSLLVRGVDWEGDILKHPTALKDAFGLGLKLARGSI
ncbi:flavodoxin family protein [Chloroflexota bacterium]